MAFYSCRSPLQGQATWQNVTGDVIIEFKSQLVHLELASTSREIIKVQHLNQFILFVAD